MGNNASYNKWTGSQQHEKIIASCSNLVDSTDFVRDTRNGDAVEEVRERVGCTVDDWKKEEVVTTTAPVLSGRVKQIRFQSLSNLNDHWSWRFARNASRKSLISLDQQRRAKTLWHKPLTNIIFSSHFKESHRNEQYHIERLVAKGAFGVVYKVIAKDVQRREKQSEIWTDVEEGNIIKHDKKERSDANCIYALKVLRKSEIIAENCIRQIKDEVDIQKLCGHHPFIVRQVKLWQDRYSLHILSEYMPNGELFSKFKKFSIALVRLYTAEIALAIDFLHNAGIIYRDAKPENILLTQNFHIKLTDFGLSKWLKLGSTTNTMCGTLQYMAPEILCGGHYGHAADWWSLGVIICQMLLNQFPDMRAYCSTSILSAMLKTPGNAKECNESNGINKTEGVPSPHSLESSYDHLPAEVEHLSHECCDVIKRLLEIDARKRIHSVLGLQRIALYQNFQINISHLLNINVPEIIKHDKDNIILELTTAEEMDANVFSNF